MTTSENNLTREQKIANFLKTIDCEEIDLPYFADEDQRNYQDLYDSIEEKGGFDIEIIYYSRAIEYLKDNDPSLRNSLEIADEYGMDIKNISSETLASLLASQNAREELSKYQDEIEDFFTELNEEEERQQEREDNFEPTAFLTLTNTGGIELMIDETGETAFYRFTAGDTTVEESEIQHDQEGEPYFLIGETAYYLSEFLKS